MCSIRECNRLHRCWIWIFYDRYVGKIEDLQTLFFYTSDHHWFIADHIMVRYCCVKRSKLRQGGESWIHFMLHANLSHRFGSLLKFSLTKTNRHIMFLWYLCEFIMFIIIIYLIYNLCEFIMYMWIYNVVRNFSGKSLISFTFNERVCQSANNPFILSLSSTPLSGWMSTFCSRKLSGSKVFYILKMNYMTKV